MRRFLDARSQRIAATVELLVNNKGWMTAGELASAIGTSKRTESDDIALMRLLPKGTMVKANKVGGSGSAAIS